MHSVFIKHQRKYSCLQIPQADHILRDFKDTEYLYIIFTTASHYTVCHVRLVTQSCQTSCNPRLQPSRLLRPWDFPGKNTGVGCHFLLQGIFPTQGLNPGIEPRPPAWQADSLLSELPYQQVQVYSIYSIYVKYTQTNIYKTCQIMSHSKEANYL